MKSLAFVLLFFLPLLSCSAKFQQAAVADASVVALKDTISPPALVDTNRNKIVHFHLPYQLGKPQETFVLPQNLKEISGLSTTTNNREVLTAIQDEDGTLFHINKNTGKVEQEIPFYKPGDYEGIEVIGDKVYVVKSTGTLYEIKDLENAPPYVKKHKFFLSKANDVEGLCYDAKKNCLLLACKGMPITGQSEEFTKFQKAIYSFSLDSDTMEVKPSFIFNLSDIQDYLVGREAMAHYDKLYGYFNPDVENLIFSPSAIAIHPITSHIYMTSSPKKILMVFDQKGNILHLEKMNKKFHPQPEGMTFDEDGTLYMANEGKGDGAGTILKFAYQPEIAEH
ncbi:MAG: SdiA-regulated domain-containing protein [Saprospiraceae bacterium]